MHITWDHLGRAVVRTLTSFVRASERIAFPTALASTAYCGATTDQFPTPLSAVDSQKPSGSFHNSQMMPLPGETRRPPARQ